VDGNQKGTQHLKCMVSSHDLCLLLIAQALVYTTYSGFQWRRSVVVSALA